MERNGDRVDVHVAPARDLRPKHDPGAPCVVGGHGEGVEVGIIRAPVDDHLKRRADRNRSRADGGGVERPVAGGQVFAEDDSQLKLQTQPVIVGQAKRCRACEYLVGEDAPGDGMIDAAKLLLHRARQRDLSASEGAAPFLAMNFMQAELGGVGFVDVARGEVASQISETMPRLMLADDLAGDGVEAVGHGSLPFSSPWRGGRAASRHSL